MLSFYLTPDRQKISARDFKNQLWLSNARSQKKNVRTFLFSILSFCFYFVPRKSNQTKQNKRRLTKEKEKKNNSIPNLFDFFDIKTSERANEWASVLFTTFNVYA